MIRSFADRQTERLFHDEDVKAWRAIERPARRKLLMLHRAGQFSIRVNDQWRICFRFVDGEAFDVALIDYH